MRWALRFFSLDSIIMAVETVYGLVHPPFDCPWHSVFLAQCNSAHERARFLARIRFDRAGLRACEPRRRVSPSSHFQSSRGPRKTSGSRQMSRRCARRLRD
ncbi:hypothetical protein LZ31DRAFT_281915 [Colletotrichum somersetense]|nr:hypothetical protein LZ31DRAFT_281915 [Colletotrichum somersetense]